MNKAIIININSIVFHIEEDAYEVLRNYMIDIKKHFAYSADSAEILQDIENRIAEMFSDRIHTGKKEVIALEDVNDVIGVMGKVSDFEQAESEEEGNYDGNTEETADHQTKYNYEKKLLRNPDDKMVAGVCSGLGYYFGMDAKWMRLIFVLFFVFGGSGILLYLVLWVVMPQASTRADRMAMRGQEPNIENFKKNVETEWEGFKGSFSEVTNKVSKGTASVTGGVSSIFRVIGSVLGFGVLFVCGMTIIGLLIGWAGFATGILGYQSEMVFPPTEIFSPATGLLALTTGTAAIMIPFIALFHLMVRILFKTRSMNSYFSLTLWAGWIVSIIAIVVFVIMGVSEFKESSTIKLEKPLSVANVYSFYEKDIREIDASSNERGEKNFKIQVNGDDLASRLRNDIRVKFESIDSLEKPFIVYSYSAAGRTYQAAADRASKIHYLAKEEKGKILFDSHFELTPSERYRDQAVVVTVYLPVGAKVVLSKDLRRKFREFYHSACSDEFAEEVKVTEWIMTKKGLTCAPNFILSKEKTSADTEPDVEESIREVEAEVRRIEEEITTESRSN